MQCTTSTILHTTYDRCGYGDFMCLAEDKSDEDLTSECGSWLHLDCSISQIKSGILYAIVVHMQ